MFAVEEFVQMMRKRLEVDIDGVFLISYWWVYSTLRTANSWAGEMGLCFRPFVGKEYEQY